MRSIVIGLIVALGWTQTYAAAPEWQDIELTSAESELIFRSGGWMKWMDQCAASLNLRTSSLEYGVSHPLIRSKCTSQCFKAGTTTYKGFSPADKYGPLYRWNQLCGRMEISASNSVLSSGRPPSASSVAVINPTTARKYTQEDYRECLKRSNEDVGLCWNECKNSGRSEFICASLRGGAMAPAPRKLSDKDKQEAERAVKGLVEKANENPMVREGIEELNKKWWMKGLKGLWNEAE